MLNSKTVKGRHLMVFLGLAVLSWFELSFEEAYLPVKDVTTPTFILMIAISLVSLAFMSLGMYPQTASSSSVKSDLLDLSPMALALLGMAVISDVNKGELWETVVTLTFEGIVVIAMYVFYPKQATVTPKNSAS